MIELSTQCPQCQHRFTVTLQQLQQRKGLSRCAQCAHIFDAYECAVPGSSSTKPIAARSVLREHFIGKTPLRHGVILAPLVHSRKKTINSAQPIQSDTEPSFSDIRVYLDRDESVPSIKQASIHTDRVMFNPEPRSAPAVGFSPVVKQSWSSTFWAVVFWLLLLCALIQLVYVYRVQIVNTVGFTRPALQLMCDKVGCDLPYMREISAIEITHSRLQEQARFDSGAPYAYYLQLQLNNNLTWAQEWPTLVISFSDAAAATLATIAVSPQQYLTPSQQGLPFRAGGQHSVRLPVRIANKKINGFSVDKYYAYEQK